MASETKTARWKLIAGYAAFSLVAFILCVLLTFPYDAVRTRIVTEAAARGLAVRIGGLRPGLSGVTATNVRVSKPPTPLGAESVAALARGEAGGLGPEELGEALTFDSVALRPSLFPPGLVVNAKAMGGTVHVAVGGLSATSLDVNVNGLQAGAGNLPGYTGVDMEGVLNAKVALTAPGALVRGQPADWSQATGTVALDTQGLTIKGGKAAIPMGGGPAMPMDLPRVLLGELKGDLQFDKGLGTVRDLNLKSEDLEGTGSGTVKLGKRLEYSELGLDVRLKFEDAFQQRLGPLAIAVNMLPQDRENPGYRGGRLTGMVSSPRFGPKR
ncbi:type II secretion system protein GspN [Corallococcus sp. BB11-1]|uniref:type II secretion system protein GspN n=1 Tax=Corallococcus sp. BB11-1 TaxID=2996783 RepID=UPI00226E13C7|nr:type II secretion system protein GspN [Corallococcus sp. BB11-1]MCY1034182.1 type II secretion system protein GspN [Corallococcus sp. BB11-1]